MKVRTLIAAAVAGALAAPLAAQAAGQATTGASAGADMNAVLVMDAATFARLDQNNDGYLSSDEVRLEVGVNDRFSQLDTDRDNRISREEWDGAASAGAGASTGADASQTQDRATTPPPGGVTDVREGATSGAGTALPTEGRAGAPSAEGASAGAGSGTMSEDRATTPPPGGVTDVREGATSGAGTALPTEGRAGGMGQGASTGAAGATFESLDRDGDGYISREEAGDWSVYGRHDQDGDGRISRGEFGSGSAAAGATTAPSSGTSYGTPETTPRATTPPPGGVTDEREGATSNPPAQK